MKKKLFLTLVISMLCFVAFTLAVLAKDVDIKINDVNGNSIVLPTVDGDGDPLTWYRITEKPTDVTYFEYISGNTTYYIVSVKTKDAAYVNDNYRVCYSYSGITTGTYGNGNIIAANLKGLTHADGKGPEYFNFTFEYTSICYAYIPASILELKGQRGTLLNLFQGCGNLVEIDFEAGSKIETLYANGFYECRKLTYIKLPENLKTISAAAFVSISPTLVVPKSVTTFEVSNYSYPTVQFTGTAADHVGWAYQPSNISYVEHCDVYHDGQHLAGEDDFDCTTSLLCVNCGKELASSQDSHNIVTDCTYAKGFLNKGVYEIKCQNSGCNYVEQSKELEALFTCLGYSAPENGEGGISIKYTVNSAAIEEYTKATGIELSYGLFATTKQAIGNADIFDGEGNTINGAIALDITKADFAFLSLKMVGFDTEESKKVDFAIGAYVVTTENGLKKYSYLQQGTPAAGEKYAYIKYNDFVSTNS